MHNVQCASLFRAPVIGRVKATIQALLSLTCSLEFRTVGMDRLDGIAAFPLVGETSSFTVAARFKKSASAGYIEREKSRRMPALFISANPPVLSL